MRILVFLIALAFPTASAFRAQGRAEEKPAQAERKKYTGKRVDLDFRDAEVRKVLDLLANIGMVKLVVPDDLGGQITIKMRDVPWDQALDVVARGKRMKALRDGDTIRLEKLAQ